MPNALPKPTSVTPAEPTVIYGTCAAHYTELKQRLDAARLVTDRLFERVEPDALYQARPIAERHRLIFYLGHLEAFDWNLLNGYWLAKQPFAAEFDQLFAFGIDPVGGGLPNDEPQHWPRRAEIDAYNRRIRNAIDAELIELAAAAPDSVVSVSQRRAGELAAQPQDLALLMNTAIEHRLMHAETLAYLLHRLPLDALRVRGVDTARNRPDPANSMLQVDAGPVWLGQRRGDGQFGWDNEFEATERHTDAFSIDRYMVSNRAFLDFVEAGGYRERRWWSDSDWAWREASGIEHPAFWQRRGETWMVRAMFDEVELPAAWPAYVSHAEAAAYARWAGKRLPSEAEWQRAALGDASAAPASLAHTASGNVGFRHFDPVAVDHPMHPVSPFGAVGMWGNGWEWTGQVFEPLPGFASYPFYRGYSADFFDGAHFVMKGGSPHTAAVLQRPSFRNWFQPHYQYVYAGFRCVAD